MKKHLLTVIAVMMASSFLFAQEAAKVEEKKEGWFRTAGIGFDAGQLAVINPRVGAGENRINLGGAANFSLNYKKGRLAWDNGLAAILAVQKLGNGVTPIVGTVGGTKKPFQKSTDELRLNSKLGYAIKEGGKLFGAVDGSILTQTTPTFEGNYLAFANKKGLGNVISQFFSPAIVTFAVGIDYKPTPKLSFFYSPIALRGVIVQNSDIAVQPATVGAKVNVFGVATDKSALYDFGSMLRGIYSDKFLSDKLVFNSNLGLFGAYQSGKGIKVDWANQIAWNLYKGLQLGLNVNVFYDKNILVQVTDKTGLNGVKINKTTNKPELVNNKASIIQQLLLKYATTF
jgi:Protein of unknown function (DUF3078)